MRLGCFRSTLKHLLAQSQRIRWFYLVNCAGGFNSARLLEKKPPKSRVARGHPPLSGGCPAPNHQMLSHNPHNPSGSTSKTRESVHHRPPRKVPPNKRGSSLMWGRKKILWGHTQFPRDCAPGFPLGKVFAGCTVMCFLLVRLPQRVGLRV